MSIFRSLRRAAWAGGLAAIAFLAGCGGGGGSTPAPTASGGLNLTVTDAPSDAWQQVTVQLTSASLRAQGGQAWTQVWAADPAHPVMVNLVDLSSVADLLAKVSVPAGTYDRLQLTLNPDPASMTLVDDTGTAIPTADITVVDPSGKGQINVVLEPALTITAGATASLQADFDLAHPLSIIEETVGGVTKVVLNLQVRHKALPARVQDLQFARKLGQVTAVTSAGFTLKDARGVSFDYLADATSILVDADAKAAGSLAGLTVGKYALVASNLNADGTLFARRVWYADAAATLPSWSPEGLVRRVDLAHNSFTVCTKTPATSATSAPAWTVRTVKVDANTVWTFHTSVAMGTGTGYLKDIWRGTRVDVTLGTDGTTAAAVNVSHAHDEGFISSVTAQGLTFGWPGTQPSMFGMGDLAGRTWTYYQNPADPTHAFSWWFFGLPSSASTSVTDLTATVAAAQAMHLPVAGTCSLYWDTVSGSWQAYQLVLAPERLNATMITTGYSDGPAAGSGTLGVTFLSPMPLETLAATPMTVTLDYAGDLQTVVESLVWNSTTRVFTLQVPVPHDQWATLLVPSVPGSLNATRIWVRPVLNGASVDWHAYNVEQLTLQ